MDFLSKQEIRPYFEGKSVAIVGSGPGVLLNPEGKIDSHNVVVRVNNYKIIPPATGTRTDVFYSFFGQTVRKSREDLMHDGVKLCMCKCPNSKPIESHWHERRRNMRGVDFRWIYEERANWWFCPTYVPTARDFMRLFDLFGKHVPTTGIAATVEIIQLQPSHIYLTGFDFFTSGKHNVDEKWRPGRPDDPIGHDPMKERDWLREHWRDYPLSGDPALMDQLGSV